MGKNSRWLEFLNHLGMLYVLDVKLEKSSSKSVQLKVAGMLLWTLGCCRRLGPTLFQVIVRYFPPLIRAKLQNKKLHSFSAREASALQVLHN